MSDEDAAEIEPALPEVAQIRADDLRAKTVATWERALGQNGWTGEGLTGFPPRSGCWTST